MLYRFVALGLMFTAASTAANDDAREVLVALAGQWDGELYYLDYQSGERFSIPMTAEIEATPDGATVIRHLTWSDPNSLVYAIQISTFDRDTGELVEAFYREGKGEYMRYDVSGLTIESAANWQIVYEHLGYDADRPALIRHTMTRDRNLLTSKKAVCFRDADEDSCFERNGSELRLIAAQGE